MFWFLIIIFCCLVVVVAFAIVPKSYNKNIRMHLLDVIVCMMGGGALVIMILLFRSGQQGYSGMDVGRFFSNYNWKLKYLFNVRGDQFLNEFVFGYIFTYLCIWLKRQYNKLK